MNISDLAPELIGCLRTKIGHHGIPSATGSNLTDESTSAGGPNRTSDERL
jgi:hypothetical protein